MQINVAELMGEENIIEIIPIISDCILYSNLTTSRRGIWIYAAFCSLAVQEYQTLLQSLPTSLSMHASHRVLCLQCNLALYTLAHHSHDCRAQLLPADGLLDLSVCISSSTANAVTEICSARAMLRASASVFHT